LIHRIAFLIFGPEYWRVSWDSACDRAGDPLQRDWGYAIVLIAITTLLMCL
jgi:hypothetical protein